MTPITCVIFDLDDTLYNERTYVEQAMRNVADYLFDKYHISSDESYSNMIHLLDTEGRGKIFDRIIDKYAIDEDVKTLVQVYRESKPELVLYEDAEAFLVRLGEKGIRTAIITDGCSLVQHNKIEGLHLEERMDVIIATADYDNAGKPSTVPYRMVMDKLGIENPSECVYIGDNPTKDFAGAREVGMRTVRIIRPVGDCMKYQVQDDYEADEVIHLLTEWSKI